MSKKGYGEEFKRGAVEQVTQRGYSVKDVSKRLGVSSHTLYVWVRRYSGGKAGQAALAADELHKENLRLKSELRRMTEERNILKKAAAYFANPSE